MKHKHKWLVLTNRGEASHVIPASEDNNQAIQPGHNLTINCMCNPRVEQGDAPFYQVLLTHHCLLGGCDTAVDQMRLN